MLLDLVVDKAWPPVILQPGKEPVPQDVRRAANRRQPNEVYIKIFEVVQRANNSSNASKPPWLRPLYEVIFDRQHLPSLISDQA